MRRGRHSLADPRIPGNRRSCTANQLPLQPTSRHLRWTLHRVVVEVPTVTKLAGVKLPVVASSRARPGTASRRAASPKTVPPTPSRRHSGPTTTGALPVHPVQEGFPAKSQVRCAPPKASCRGKAFSDCRKVEGGLRRLPRFGGGSSRSLLVLSGQTTTPPRTGLLCQVQQETCRDSFPR